ncbi:MAG: type II secretion system F family protein [Desulfovibrio sp.]|nr:type II secretion system F family protein [Desulfovibrio sp.]
MERIRLWLLRRRFGVTVRIRLWRALACQCERLTVWQALALHLARARQKVSPLAEVYERMLACRDSGTSLAESLQGLASPEELMLVKAGEQSGRISQGFRLAAELLQSRDAVARAVRGGLAYPAFLCLACVAMLVMVSRLIIPQLASVLAPEQWTGLARILWQVSSAVDSPAGALAGLALLGLGGAVVWALPRWQGALRDKVDGWGPWGVYRTMVGSAWLYTLAVLMQAGMQVRTILDEMLTAPSTTPYLAERIQAVARQYALGKTLGDALCDAGHAWPSEETCELLQAYASVPGMERQLMGIARELMEEDVERVKRSIKRLNTVMLCLVCGVALLMLGGSYAFQTSFAVASSM